MMGNSDDVCDNVCVVIMLVVMVLCGDDVCDGICDDSNDSVGVRECMVMYVIVPLFFLATTLFFRVQERVLHQVVAPVSSTSHRMHTHHTMSISYHMHAHHTTCTHITSHARYDITCMHAHHMHAYHIACTHITCMI